MLIILRNAKYFKYVGIKSLLKIFNATHTILESTDFASTGILEIIRKIIIIITMRVLIKHYRQFLVLLNSKTYM